MDSSTTSPSSPLTGSCHCGAVTIRIPSAPIKLNSCQCTVCFTYGSLWCYYPRGQVDVFDNTLTTEDKKVLGNEGQGQGHGVISPYVRHDIGGNNSFNHCTRCGTVTHWWGRGDYGGDDYKMGVNARIFGTELVNNTEKEINYK